MFFSHKIIQQHDIVTYMDSLQSLVKAFTGVFDLSEKRYLLLLRSDPVYLLESFATWSAARQRFNEYEFACAALLDLKQQNWYTLALAETQPRSLYDLKIWLHLDSEICKRREFEEWAALWPGQYNQVYNWQEDGAFKE